MPVNPETNPPEDIFDFTAYPADTLFHDRREGRDRRQDPHSNHATTRERRARPERRRRVDPTTFEKQYSNDELEFMNAIQTFKVQSGKTFPSYGEVLQIALRLGYQRKEPLGPDSSSNEL